MSPSLISRIPYGKIGFAVAVAALGGFLDCRALADDELGDTIDLTDFPGSLVEDVIVPVPSELFAVLDKLGSPNWNEQLRKVEEHIPKGRRNIALRMGAVVAEGFIAVQAEDKKSMQDIGKLVLRLADALGVRNSIERHSQVILDASEDGDWERVRSELDKTQQTVKTTMDDMKDEHVAQCVSIGGWLRGTEAVSSVIKAGYSTEKAGLLNQPDIVAHFVSALKKMPKGPNLAKIHKGLKEVSTLMGAGDSPIKSDAVDKIHSIVQSLVQLNEKRK